MDSNYVKNIIRDVPDFPKPGILFKDLTTLFSDPKALRETVKSFVDKYKNAGITKVVGIESRGFLLGPIVAYELGAGFIPVRKPGKLPFKTFSQEYELEYGSDKIEIHADALNANDVVLLHDDLLATGGTMEAAITLVQQFGCSIEAISFIVELSFLEGRKRLENKKMDVYSMITY